MKEKVERLGGWKEKVKCPRNIRVGMELKKKERDDKAKQKVIEV
jgi:hypothetical protein